MNAMHACLIVGKVFRKKLRLHNMYRQLDSLYVFLKYLLNSVQMAIDVPFYVVTEDMQTAFNFMARSRKSHPDSSTAMRLDFGNISKRERARVEPGNNTRGSS